jgi:hypothetical protein
LADEKSINEHRHKCIQERALWLEGEEERIADVRRFAEDRKHQAFMQECRTKDELEKVKREREKLKADAARLSTLEAERDAHKAAVAELARKRANLEVDQDAFVALQGTVEFIRQRKRQIDEESKTLNDDKVKTQATKLDYESKKRTVDEKEAKLKAEEAELRSEKTRLAEQKASLERWARELSAKDPHNWRSSSSGSGGGGGGGGNSSGRDNVRGRLGHHKQHQSPPRPVDSRPRANERPSDRPPLPRQPNSLSVVVSKDANGNRAARRVESNGSDTPTTSSTKPEPLTASANSAPSDATSLEEAIPEEIYNNTDDMWTIGQ